MKKNLNEFEAAAYLTEHGSPTTVDQLRAWRKMPWHTTGRNHGPEFYDLPRGLLYPIFELNYYLKYHVIKTKGIKKPD